MLRWLFSALQIHLKYSSIGEGLTLKTDFSLFLSLCAEEDSRAEIQIYTHLMDY